MNAEVQKFDIRFGLDEKLKELTEVYGMERGAALRLIQSAIDEWSASQQPAGSGAGWAMSCKTFKIRPCDRDTVDDREVWFESYVEANSYLVRMSRR